MRCMFAPLELSWVVGGIDSGVGGRGKFAVPGRDDDRATPLLNAQRVMIKGVPAHLIE